MSLSAALRLLTGTLSEAFDGLYTGAIERQQALDLSVVSCRTFDEIYHRDLTFCSHSWQIK